MDVPPKLAKGTERSLKKPTFYFLWRIKKCLFVWFFYVNLPQKRRLTSDTTSRPKTWRTYMLKISEKISKSYFFDVFVKNANISGKIINSHLSVLIFLVIFNFTLFSPNEFFFLNMLLNSGRFHIFWPVLS